MAILSINTSSTGTVGVDPRLIEIQTTDTLAVITATGYLNSAVASGFSIGKTDLALVSGSNLSNDGGYGSSPFQVIISNGQYSLAQAPSSTAVTNVLGSANRITSSGGNSPIIDISDAYAGQTSIVTTGTIGTGKWRADVVEPAYGGTGVANSGTITVGGNTALNGAYTFAGTLTGNTSVTFPTSGTLATTAGLPSLPLSASNGGTGVSNTGTITVGGNTAFNGPHTFTGTVTADTAVTFPVTGTLATIEGLPALPLTITNGGTGMTALPTTYAGSTYAAWDANSNLSANSLIQGYATTATGGATTTLTAASAQQQYFTGSTTQTVVMPVVSTLVLGQSYALINESSGVVTVRSSGTNVIQAMDANTSLVLTVVSISGTDASSWNAQYTLQSQSIPTTTLLGNPTGGTAIASPITLDSNSLSMFLSEIRVALSAGGFVSKAGFYGSGLQVDPAIGGQTVSLLIISDDFKLLNTTPYIVYLYDDVPAGAIAVVDSFFVYALNGGTTPYTGGGDFVLQYGGTPGATRATIAIPASTITTLSTGAEQFFGAPGILSIPTTTAINISSAIGKNLYLYVDSANFAAGDTNFAITINYHFVSP